MNYRDMLLQDYFDESYDDYDDYDELLTEDALDDRIKALHDKMINYGRDAGGSVRFNSKGEPTFSNLSKDERKELEKMGNDYITLVRQVDAFRRGDKQSKYFVDFSGQKGVGDPQWKINQRQKAKRKDKIRANDRANMATFDDYKNSPEYQARYNEFMHDYKQQFTPEQLKLINKEEIKKQATKYAESGYGTWRTNTNVNNGALRKNMETMDKLSARNAGSSDASAGVAPNPSKISRAKAWAGDHKRQLAIGGAAAASAAGAGVTASGVKNIADLKNITKAKAAWKASGSNLPFEQWRKKQLTKAGIKTGIGGALTALGAGGAVYAAKTKKLNEAEDLMNQYELVELEEAYLEGYYGQLIAEECGFDSEEEMIYYNESLYDYDEDYMLPYFG